MFSGIIKDLGKIANLTEQTNNKDLTVKILTLLPLDKLQIGASISCDGVCLTVVESGKADDNHHYFVIEISAETLKVTSLGDWQKGSFVNLEPALTLADGLDGHLVSGHIDDLAVLKQCHENAGSQQMVFFAPQEFSAFITRKGSVCLNGVSLTVNQVSPADSLLLEFTCNIISHTAKLTNLGTIKIGDKVNLEIDLLARYMERFLMVNKSK